MAEPPANPGIATAALISWHDGLPLMDWARVSALAPSAPAGLHAFWCDLQRQWLTALAPALAPAGRFHETDHLMLVLQCRSDPRWIAESAERLSDQIRAGLKDGRTVASTGKLALLLFSGEANLRRYLRLHGATGGVGHLVTVGCCITDGCVHVALAGLSGFNTKLPHELAHAVLAPYRPPTWVTEGFALWVERHIGHRTRFRPSPSDRQALRQFYLGQSAQTFWSGRAFSHASGADYVIAAYQFAAMLVDYIYDAHRTHFSAFITNAAKSDQGLAAAQQHLGLSLNALASALLGPGDWHMPQSAVSEAEREEADGSILCGHPRRYTPRP